MLVLIPIFTIAPSLHNYDEPIPQWIKKDAKMWHDEESSDNEFVNCIKWAVEKKVIPIRYAVFNGATTSDTSPELKNIAYYWSIGKVSDSDFTSTIRHMIQNGVIPMNDDFGVSMKHEMDKVSVVNDTQKSVVVIPVLTSSAYVERGFYSNYKKECDKTCLTVPIRDDSPSFMSSANGIKVLRSLGYKMITDVEVDSNPHILEQYDKVIVLHNEYVTQPEFDAITKHPHVIYLYPNALYAKVSINYWNNTMTLIQGHGYPDSSMGNGFSWKFDNSVLEYDRECKNWRFDKIVNGIMLNCYPESRLNYDTLLLETIKNF